MFRAQVFRGLSVHYNYFLTFFFFFVQTGKIILKTYRKKAIKVLKKIRTLNANKSPLSKFLKRIGETVISHQEYDTGRGRGESLVVL